MRSFIFNLPKLNSANPKTNSDGDAGSKRRSRECNSDAIPNESNKVQLRSGFQFRSGFMTGLVAGFFVWSTIMVTAFIVLTLLGGSFLSAATQDSDSSKSASEKVADQEFPIRPIRPIGEIRADVKAFVKNSKKEDDIELQVGAVMDLCQLHWELVNDPRYETHNQLQSFRAVASNRLKGFVKEMELKKKRLAREAKKSGKASSQLAGADAFEKEGLTDADGNPYETDDDSKYDDAIGNSMASSMYSISQFTGGPANMFGYLRGNFAPPWHDAELINLIETTINPAHWKSNGGDGAIFWYDPAKALVITGTSEVHDKVSDLLKQMRFLSR